MNVNYINPFLQGTKEVFDTMVQLPIVMNKPYLRRNAELKYDVSVAIGISGAVTGAAIMSFPLDVAVASGLAQAVFKSFDQDCIDALGEIANMIAGSAKARLPGGQNKLSLPNVVLGQHRVALSSGVPIIVIPCEVKLPGDRKTSAGFIVEIAFKEAAANQPPAEVQTPVIAAVAKAR